MEYTKAYQFVDLYVDLLVCHYQQFDQCLQLPVDFVLHNNVTYINKTCLSTYNSGYCAGYIYITTWLNYLLLVCMCTL